MIVDYSDKYIKILGTYLIKDIDEFFLTNIEQDLDRKPVLEIIDCYIKDMKCDRYDSEHKFRLMQTIGFPYKILVSKLVWFISKYCDTDEVYDKIKKQHEFNLQFEKENPPIQYLDKKISKVKTVKQSRTTKTKSKPKQTKEEKKVAKINAKFATFNIPKIKL